MQSVRLILSVFFNTENEEKNNINFLIEINVVFLSYYQSKTICKLLFVAVYSAVVACEIRMSYRTDVINHLTADRTCLLSGEVAVITLL